MASGSFSSADAQDETVAAPVNGGANVKEQVTTSSPQDSNAAQPDPASQVSQADYDDSLGLHVLKNIALDQKALWTSPVHLRAADTAWLVPAIGVTAGLFQTDRDTSLHFFSNNPATLKHYDNLSNYGLFGMGGATGALYLWGSMTRDDHKKESGLLAGEAAVDSLAIVTALKYATGRQRPQVGNRAGDFWSGGDSFPSDHAAISMAIAGVLAHEYPGPLTQLLAYGGATMIGLARVQAKQHFPTDVLVGTAIGWLTSEYVYKTHHDPELGGDTWHWIGDSFTHEHRYQSPDMGSPSVPMDNWIYPALDRLEALGYVPEGIQGQRPWTRMECARLTNAAADQLAADPGSSPDAERIVADLQREFASEIDLLGGGTNRSARIESVYARVTTVSGPPLSQGYNYDFGQTIVDDYGRPYERGFNAIEGASGSATFGPLFGYVRGEYQYAPGAPAITSTARQVIQQVQGLPQAPPGTPIGAVSHMDLLEGYFGAQWGNWQFTYGKQELSWGPDHSPMLFSDNAAPIEMFQINRVRPFVLPGFLRHIGPMRVQMFLGRLTGNNFLFSSLTGFTGTWTQPLANQPFISGEKVSFKPSPNLEWGFGITLLSAGQGVPFTLHKYLQGLFSISDAYAGGAYVYGGPHDPGDHRSEFDFTYHIPKLRNWLTWYADSFADDEITPWRNWAKAAVTSGLYMPRLPKLAHLDLRVEGMFTDVPSSQPVLQHGFFYFDPRYRDGYTNGGELIGSWIGRQGQGAYASSTYWLSPKSNIQVNFRHEKVSREFIPQGGTITDGGAHASFWIHSMLNVSAGVQYETWKFPVIAPGEQSNVTTTIGLTFWPGKHGAIEDREASPVTIN